MDNSCWFVVYACLDETGHTTLRRTAVRLLEKRFFPIRWAEGYFSLSEKDKKVEILNFFEIPEETFKEFWLIMISPRFQILNSRGQCICRAPEISAGCRHAAACFFMAFLSTSLPFLRLLGQR